MTTQGLATSIRPWGVNVGEQTRTCKASLVGLKNSEVFLPGYECFHSGGLGAEKEAPTHWIVSWKVLGGHGWQLFRAVCRGTHRKRMMPVLAMA